MARFGQPVRPQTVRCRVVPGVSTNADRTWLGKIIAQLGTAAKPPACGPVAVGALMGWAALSKTSVPVTFAGGSRPWNLYAPMFTGGLPCPVFDLAESSTKRALPSRAVVTPTGTALLSSASRHGKPGNKPKLSSSVPSMPCSPVTRISSSRADRTNPSPRGNAASGVATRQCARTSTVGRPATAKKPINLRHT